MGQLVVQRSAGCISVQNISICSSQYRFQTMMSKKRMGITLVSREEKMMTFLPFTSSLWCKSTHSKVKYIECTRCEFTQKPRVISTIKMFCGARLLKLLTFIIGLQTVDKPECSYQWTGNRYTTHKE